MSAEPRTESGQQAEERWLGLTKAEWLLGVTVLLVVGLFVHPYRAQQASRYALTAAVVEQGTVVLDDYDHVLGRDRAVRGDHIYSDKAPGQPLLAVPFFALGKAGGVEEADVLRVEGNLGVWWVTLWSASLPGAALAVMVYRRTRVFMCRGALFGAVVALAGSMLLPFSTLLFGHALGAALIYGSYLLVGGEGSGGRLGLAGLLAGVSVAVEYTAVLAVVVLGIHAFWLHRWSALVLLVGGVPIAAALAIYNAVAFGDPFTLSYQYTAFDEVAASSRDVLTIFSTGSLENIWRLLVEGRGLLLATPVIVLALVAAARTLRKGFQIDAAMALAMFLAFIWIPVFWGNPWGGASPGPRYIIPCLPFLAVPIAWAWQRWPRVTIAASLLSIVTMVAATVTDPILNRESVNGLNAWLQWLLDGDVADTVLTIGLGSLGWVIHICLVLGAATLLIRAHVESCGSAKSI